MSRNWLPFRNTSKCTPCCCGDRVAYLLVLCVVLYGSLHYLFVFGLRLTLWYFQTLYTCVWRHFSRVYIRVWKLKPTELYFRTDISLDGIWTHINDTLQHQSLSLMSSALDHTAKSVMCTLYTVCGYACIHLSPTVKLGYVTFQRNSEIWSHKTGGRLVQV
jgi:hypothetical protein